VLYLYQRIEIGAKQKPKDMKLTKKENQVLDFICEELRPWKESEPGYSDITAKDIKINGLSRHQIAGVISSLHEKELVHTSSVPELKDIIYPNWSEIDKALSENK